MCSTIYCEGRLGSSGLVRLGKSACDSGANSSVFLRAWHTRVPGNEREAAQRMPPERWCSPQPEARSGR